MTLLAKIRSRHLPLARALVALFAVGWLGLALQPCQAMAPAGSGHAGHDDGPDGHHGTLEHHSTPAHCETPCPHCPADGPEGCDGGVALDCEAVGVPAPPAKQVPAPALDAWVWHAPAVLPTVPVASRAARPDWPDPGRGRAPAVSLQKRYCTYLK